MLTAGALLLVAVAALWRFMRGDRRSYAGFKALPDTRMRQRRMLRWTRNAFLLFAGLSLAGLALLGRLDALWRFPPEFLPARRMLPSLGAIDPGFLAMIAGAVVAGGLVGGLLTRLRGGRDPVFGDIRPMMPRNRAEAACALLLALNAGVVEEIFFRLFVPLLLVLAGVPAPLAFLIALLLFAAMHRYQGWAGIAATAAMGAVFTAALLMSGGLALPVMLHMLLNLNGLVLRPWLAHNRAGT